MTRRYLDRHAHPSHRPPLPPPAALHTLRLPLEVDYETAMRLVAEASARMAAGVTLA